MGFITTIYFTDDFKHLLEELKVYAQTRGMRGVSPLVQQILEEWLSTNRRYVESKITDYKMEAAEIMKHSTVACKECGVTEKDVDEFGCVKHTPECSEYKYYVKSREIYVAAAVNQTNVDKKSQTRRTQHDRRV